MEIVAIIVSGITFIWTIFSFFLLHSQNMKLLVLQSEIDKTKHISNTQFDLEFSIYKDLSEKMLILYNDIWWLYPYGIDERYPIGASKEEQNIYKQDIFNKTVESHNLFSNALFSYAPFIDVHLYDEFEKYRKMITNQMAIYKICVIRRHDTYEDIYEKKSGISVWDRTKLINEMKNQVVTKMREYFDKLKELELKGR